MDGTQYAFAVANVRAKEAQIPDQIFYDRLEQTASYSDIKRMLIDKGFSGFEKTDDSSQALKNYLSETYQYIMEISPQKDILDFLIVRNDFHNLKASIKGIMAGINAENYFLSPSVIPCDELNTNVGQKKYYNLPKWIEKIAENAYDILSSTMDGQIFDMYVDKASLEVMTELASSEFSKEISKKLCAIANLKTAIRMSRMKASDVLYEYAFAESDILDNEELKKASLHGMEAVVSYMENTDFSNLGIYAQNSLSEFERECDNIILNMLSETQRINFGPEPLIAYYMKREIECKRLRIMVGASYINGKDA